jgi:rhodanese-related sulfurtransferase
VRSRRVSEACLEAGFERIAHLAGGFGAWKAAKLPYVAINPATGAPRLVDPKNA